MTRILVDIPDQHIAALNEIAATDGVPRAEVIRNAVTKYVREHVEKASPQAAFGIWKGKNPDGLEYQEKMRSEW